MCTYFSDAPIPQYDNLVCMPYRAQTMCNDNARFSFYKFIQFFADHFFIVTVETSHVILSMRYVRPLDYARGDRASPLKNPCNPCNPCLELNTHL